MFPYRTDYIFTLNTGISIYTCTKGSSHFESLDSTGDKPLVDEPSPIRSLAADCPCIYLIFQLSHLGLFHPYVVAQIALGCPSNSGAYYLLITK